MGINEHLEEIERGLKTYLNEKRITFPRFFFLSNEELLSIVSHSKELLAVQTHMKKCFEGIQYLNFNEEKIIQGMFSYVDEHVPFITEISPFGVVGEDDLEDSEEEDKYKNRSVVSGEETGPAPGSIFVKDVEIWLKEG